MIMHDRHIVAICRIALSSLSTPEMGATFTDKHNQESRPVEIVETRVTWAAVEKAFKASAVKYFETANSPEPITIGVRNDGLTFRQSGEGSHPLV